MKYIYGEDSFIEAARVLIKINPAAAKYTVEELVDFMKNDFKPTKPGMWGTLGFYVVSSETEASDTLYCEAVLMPYVIFAYLNNERKL